MDAPDPTLIWAFFIFMAVIVKITNIEGNRSRKAIRIPSNKS